MRLSCSLHLRFKQLRNDVYLLSSACVDLPCILDTIFIRLILDKNCRGRRGLRQVSLLPLIPFCDPSCASSTSLALHLTVCAFSLAYDSWRFSPLRHRAFQIAAGNFHNFSADSSSDHGRSSSGSPLCSVIRLASVSVDQTTLRSWSVGKVQFSFTALACFSSSLLHCQCALSDPASPARLTLDVTVERVRGFR